MQTERVTFLTTPNHKAALDAFAAGSGKSVGHVVREATSRYIAQDAGEEDDAAQVAALVREINDAVPQMRADLRDAIRSIEETNREVDALLAGIGKPR